MSIKKEKPKSHHRPSKTGTSSPLGAEGLIIDIGNTRTKAAIYKGEELVEKVIWEKCTLKKVKAFSEKYDIQKAALSSTAKVSKSVEKFLKENFFYIRLTHETHLPIKNLYETPKTLGKDRLAAAVAAFDIFPKKNTLILDAGTCLTYDFVDKKGNYWGGAISPGIQMRLKAMHVFTEKLPLVNARNLQDFIGQDTETSLLSGGQMGVVMEISGFIAAYQKKFGKINIILTGGDSAFLAEHLEFPIFVNNNLVLRGLNKILNYNVQILE